MSTPRRKTETTSHAEELGQSVKQHGGNGNEHRATWLSRVAPSVFGTGRTYEKPVAWLLGRQLIGSVKGILLYTAYG
ncbi:MAG TPA: hypothetical protein VM866_01390, partial [Pyrinomonadaceae bacterium]|nr:hypothetical protein [Pyrinomonadaceae bacterium]